MHPRRTAALLGCLLSCGETDDAVIVAMRGCGLDEEPSELLIRVRGDFLVDDALEARVTDGGAELGPWPASAHAITVEGRVGARTLAVGRTARLRRGAELPVYWAAPGSLCAVASTVGFRDPGAMAVGPAGDVLLVGGRGAGGELLADIVHLRDDAEGVSRLATGLPVPGVGQTLHALGERRFLVVGGAGPGIVLSSALDIDLARSGPDKTGAQPVLLAVNGRTEPRAHHAATTLPDGRILIAGGCAEVDEGGRCLVVGARVLASSFSIVPEPEGWSLEPAPDLIHARFGHGLIGFADGVVLAWGGTGADGRSVAVIERLVPGGTFEPWGGDLSPWWSDEQSIAGAAAVDGATMILVLGDGRVLWTTDDRSGEVALALGLEPVPRRTVEILGGELVRIDDVVAPLLAIAPTSADVVWLRGTGPTVLPGPRLAAASVRLADGTVLLAGGRGPDQTPAQVLLARHRPPLDGPDEEPPPILERPETAFVDHAPGAATVRDGGIDLVASDDAPFPATMIHARGFRSRAFRLGVTLATSGEGRGHVILLGGALRAWSIALGPTIEAWHRDARGAISPLSCAADGPATASGRFRVEVGGDAIVIELDGREVARCAGIGEAAVAVGLGASGAGTVRVGAGSLSLARFPR